MFDSNHAFYYSIAIDAYLSYLKKIISNEKFAYKTSIVPSTYQYNNNQSVKSINRNFFLNKNTFLHLKILKCKKKPTNFFRTAINSHAKSMMSTFLAPRVFWYIYILFICNTNQNRPEDKENKHDQYNNRSLITMLARAVK